MRPLHFVLGAALALLSTSVWAEAWHREGDRLQLPPAGLSFPTQAATLSLTETKESSLAGEGVDNVAQYKSADGKVFATLFVYMPAYADAALTAYELEKVIGEHYGGRRESSTIVPVAGVPNAALRRVYNGASFGSPDEKLVTTAAFLRAGHWIAVARVSGPSARQAEVEAALDALLHGIAASSSIQVDPVAEPQVADCPVRPGKPAKPKQVRVSIPGLEKDPMAQMLLGAVLANGVPEKGKAPFPVSIADNGRRPVCIRDNIKIGNNMIDMMQPAGDTSKPEAIIGILNDAGRTIEMRRMGNLYTVHLHDIARTSDYGAFDRPLDPNQIAGVLLHPDAGLRSRTTYKADGKYGTEMFISMQQLKASQPNTHEGAPGGK